ncbi:dipeptide/oligopeptide/nickel ABC transporter permease/ATP-binding protein [Microbacterium sp. NPDC019599]|uniref:dipeptide/oligopeptide/nickel ABC transporter permease/ATP-binding protein n=1 Tax=Microbacterium sp. NPDC019599 TaxID=3154690 RepID=UPI0033C64896
MAQPLEGVVDSPPQHATPTREHWIQRLLRNPVAIACLVLLVVIIVIGIASPLLAPYGPNDSELDAVNAPPFTPEHLLGGDGSGRDILSRLMWGTQRTLLACVILLITALIAGVPTGLIAGYRRGSFDTSVSWINDVIMTMPGIVLLIALYSLTGPNIVLAMLVLGIQLSPGYYRLVRGVVFGVREELYVDAAKVVGLSDSRIVGRHILWAVRAPIIIQSAFVLAGGIAITAALDYLGFGNPAEASWGGMLEEAFGNIYANPLSVIWPATLISLTILAFVLMGNALRDALQPGVARRPLTNDERKALVERATSSSAARDATAAQGTLLSVRGLRVGYPVDADRVTEVVREVDLDVRRGEIRGLVGESGSGKTQTAFAIIGILSPEALVLGGAVVFDGKDFVADGAAQAHARGRRIAYIPQEPMSNLDPCFTVGSQLVAGLRAVKRISRADAKRDILMLLDRVGIKDPAAVFDLYPHQISGGMAQRVLICGAVAAGPDLIIADEPTTALDVTVQAEVLDLLRELRDERGLGMILVTHNFGVVADLCDTVSVMKDGRIVESGTALDIFRAPQQPYTKELLASTRAVDLEESSTDV